MIPPQTSIGPVELTVSDLARSTAFYESVIGLEIVRTGERRVAARAGEAELVRLVELPGAVAHPRATGLFHLALRLPERSDLARWLARAARERVPLQGMSDHFVSEAIYLADPDGHGIEIYHDRPRALWEGRVERMTTLPLDAADLLGELGDPGSEPFHGLPSGTDMGHVHLQVANISATIAFYRDVLGFALMAMYGEQAAFFAAGGYHHHVGANTWNSRGASSAAAGSASLRQVTLVLPDDAARDEAAERAARAGHVPQGLPGGILVRDPAGIPLLLASAT